MRRSSRGLSVGAAAISLMTAALACSAGCDSDGGSETQLWLRHHLCHPPTANRRRSGRARTGVRSLRMLMGTERGTASCTYRCPAGLFFACAHRQVNARRSLAWDRGSR